MFWSSPSADIQIIIFLLSISLIIAVASYIFSKKILVSIFVMSLLSNIILYGNLTYRIGISYDILWLFRFVRDIFPYINLVLFILLVVNFIRTRYAK